jgi:integrase
MYADGKRSRKKRKAESGAVGIHNSNGRLQLYFSFSGKRYYFSTGLADGPYNRKLATDAALEIEKDIKYGLFDPDNLQKYKPQRLLTTTDSVTTITTTKLTLANYPQLVNGPRIPASLSSKNAPLNPKRYR